MPILFLTIIIIIIHTFLYHHNCRDITKQVTKIVLRKLMIN